MRYLTPSICSKPGNQPLQDDIKQCIYEIKFNNSIVSADHRKGRDKVMMRKDDYFSRTAGIIERASYKMEDQRNVEFVTFSKRCVTKTAR